MLQTDRRCDIDWIRVIAIGLLLIYHVAIGFQRWGIMIGFIANEKSWDSLWIPMSMLNVWRIPLLFFVSGMGVYFAMQRRTWKQLVKERAARILIPYAVGIVAIVPIHVVIWQYHYNFDITYNPNPAHLWFLGNIFCYVILFLPLFFYLKKNENGRVVTTLKKILGHPAGLLLVLGAFVLEAILVNPNPYEMYAMTWHGFFLGLLAFFFGFCFVLAGQGFWQTALKWRWVFLLLATVLFIYRIMQAQMRVPNLQLSIESTLWIFSVFAFGHRYLNRSSTALNYLSQAAYPVYILHMIFLFLGSLMIFPLAIPVQLQFVLVLLFTVAGCFVVYEFIVRRIGFIRPLFGLKRNARAKTSPASVYSTQVESKV